MTESPEFKTADPSFAALVQQGIEKAAGFQKIALDFYAHQTADIFDSWKKFTLPGAFFPGTYVIDAAGHGLRGFVEMQKNMLDLMVRSSSQGIDVLRSGQPSVKAAAPNTDSIDVLIRERENEAAIATKVVDRIAELVSRADRPDFQNAATQQKQAAQAVPEQKQNLSAVPLQSNARLQQHGKRPKAAKQKSDL